MNLDNYECEGQLTLTDYLRSQIADRKVMDLTEFINSQGKAQYTQVKEIITQYVTDESLVDGLTNSVSVFILRYSGAYRKYLEDESRL